MEYPKIQSLWKREMIDAAKPGQEERLVPGGKVLEGEYTCPEFEAIDSWIVTEKIDGMNMRVILTREDYGDWTVDYRGRTDRAQIHPELMKHMQETFPLDKMTDKFDCDTILFGEGYGPGIQKGGYYRDDKGFILFDVFCGGWWLKHEDVWSVAEALDIPVVNWEIMTTDEAVWTVKLKNFDRLAPGATEYDYVPEGVVCRSNPLMCFRDGRPIMWKLKVRDFQCNESPKASQKASSSDVTENANASGSSS